MRAMWSLHVVLIGVMWKWAYTLSCVCVCAERRRSQSRGELVSLYVGVRGSPSGRRVAIVHNSSSVFLYDGLSGEGVAWRSPPISTAAFGSYSGSVVASD